MLLSEHSCIYTKFAFTPPVTSNTFPVEARKLQLEVKITEMENKEQTTAPISKEAIKSYLSQLKGIKDKSRFDQARIIKQFVRRVDVYADGGSGRRIQITTNLAELAPFREDKKGSAFSPPSKKGHLQGVLFLMAAGVTGFERQITARQFVAVSAARRIPLRIPFLSANDTAAI